jgi:CDP-diacylglycerol--glycerol-3-phosphate 3-phosphatidyltransferase
MYSLITPNRLTLLRIFLLPFPCLLLLSESYSGKIGALIAGFFLGITDYLDGILARKYKKVTSIGAILDPIADKIFVTSVYLVLVYLNYFNFLPVFFILLREILISFLRSWFPEKIKVLKIAKLKTLFQMSFAGLAVLIYIHAPTYKYFIDYSLWLIAIFSFVSAIPYFYRVWNKIKDFRKNLKNFFISLLSLSYPLGLLLTFPLSNGLFWINITALSFFFFKRGLVKGFPRWAYEKVGISVFIALMLTVEYIYFGKLFLSLWLILIFSFFKDGLESLKFMWKVLKLQ